MPLVSPLRLVTRDRSGSRTFTGRRYTELYEAEATVDGTSIGRPDLQANPYDITHDPLVPVIRSDVYAFDASAICAAVSARQKGDSHTWEITVEYETLTGRMSENQAQAADPRDRPPDISWSFIGEEYAVERDVTGKPVVNSAGDPFDPPYTEKRYFPVLRISRNEPIDSQNPMFPAHQPHLYVGKVNSDTFLGAAPGTALIQSIDAQRRAENTIYYWQITYEIVFNFHLPRGWQPEILDAGLNQLQTGTNSIPIPNTSEPIYDIDYASAKKIPTATPKRLNGLGRDIRQYGNPAESVYLFFTTKQAVAFAPLGLDHV